MTLSIHLFRSDTGFNSSLPTAADSPSTLVLIFGAPQYRSRLEVFEKLRSEFPKSVFMGCSTSGEIYGSGIFDGSLSIAIAKFETTRLKLATRQISNMEQSFDLGQSLAEDISGEGLKAAFILSDGLNVNGSELMRGLNQRLPPHTVVTGGLAGDGSDFKQTWVLNNGMPAPGHISVLGFYGSGLHVGHSSRGGWDFFGPERIVTKSKGNVLFELDGKPALALYKEYLGEKASGLPASALHFPLQIRSHQNDETRLVRTILAVNESENSMTFAGNIPQGSLAQLMRANFERLIEGAQVAADSIDKTGPNYPRLALAISCVGRRLVLGERAEEEVEATLKSLPPGTQQVGFYSYGEYSPLVKGHTCELHNQTMTLSTFHEII